LSSFPQKRESMDTGLAAHRPEGRISATQKTTMCILI